MEIRIFEMQSQKDNYDAIIKVFVNDNDTRNPPHCHVRYDDETGKAISEFRISLINAEIISDKNDNDLNGFLCEKDKELFVKAMSNRPIIFGFWNKFNATSWELACGLWDNGIPDDGLLNGKASIPENTKMP